MEDFNDCQKSVVWHPHPGSPWSDEIWAPELHYINSCWYIYVTGAHPGRGASHRTLVLRSDHQDPMNAASWSFLGPLKGMPDHWAIDATVFSPYPQDLYCCYSGWPLGDHSDRQQDLFLIKLASPESAIPDTLTCISRASLPWERCDGGRRGINEGPTWVEMSPDFRGIVYSASGSWTSDYKLAVLQLVGRDILEPASWWKRDAPLMISDHRKPFGPGHASFVKPPYRTDQIFCIYHGTEKPNDGWNNRKARVVCLERGHFDLRGQPLRCSALPLQQQATGHYPGRAPDVDSSQLTGKPAQAHGFFYKLKGIWNSLY